MSNAAKLGFSELLERSAEVLEREAKSIQSYFASGSAGYWPRAFAAEKKENAEMVSLAKQLRRAAKYHKPNPFGGPATTFDACANAIRAGEPLAAAMADYGLRWVRPRGK